MLIGKSRKAELRLIFVIDRDASQENDSCEIAVCRIAFAKDQHHVLVAVNIPFAFLKNKAVMTEYGVGYAFKQQKMLNMITVALVCGSANVLGGPHTSERQL